MPIKYDKLSLLKVEKGYKPNWLICSVVFSRSFSIGHVLSMK